MRISDWSSDVCSSDLDDAEIRELLSRYLGEHGFSVLTAADGGQMRAVYAAEHIDLVILDLMLPGEDGTQLCRVLRAESDIPIIMLTARSDNLERIIGLELGADDYITKRSEEHTSELQSLMRISYAVFCLKNKNKHAQQT